MAKTITNIPKDITDLKKGKLDKSSNLSDLADRAAAWLNVRPIGSTPLAGDPVNDYDAATKRWVQNMINTGTVGPTMNGVMNYGVGDFHLRDSRAYIQPYEVVSDGQLLNRADWPELWAYAQMLSPIEDADWLADPANRGKYSLGDGTTTFRVPDRNGVQSGSIAGLYGRGDGVGNGTANSSINGEVFDSGAPNITGDIGAVLSYGASGAFAYVLQKADVSGTPFGTGLGTQLVALDAAKSSEVYGRYDNEIMGRNFVGVWVIRASGGFVAANTSWSVINGDAVLPANSTVVRGGAVKSVYTVGGSLRKEVSLTAYETIGGDTSQRGAEIITGSASYKFTDAGIAQATSWNSTSDPRVKSLIEVIPDPLELMRGIRGYSWYYEHTASKGFGFLSSEVRVNFPGAVNAFGDAKLPDGTVIHDVEGVDTVGVSAALHHEAILALMEKVEKLETELAALKEANGSQQTTHQ